MSTTEASAGDEGSPRSVGVNAMNPNTEPDKRGGKPRNRELQITVYDVN